MSQSSNPPEVDVISAIQANQVFGMEVKQHEFSITKNSDFYNVIGRYSAGDFSIWLTAEKIKQIHLTLPQLV